MGGINAQLVLDNATYTQGDVSETGRGYVNALCVGGRDGDGVLTLRNKSQLYIAQTAFSGSISYVELDANPTNSHVCGSYVSTDASDSTLFRDKSLDNGGFSGFVSASRNAVSTATINVLSGSQLNTGIGFYAGNTTVNIDGEGSAVNTGARAAKYDDTMLGWVGGKATTTVNVTNGGAFNVGNPEDSANGAQDLYAGWYGNTKVNINLSGLKSTLSVNGDAYLGYTNEGYSGAVVNVQLKDHAEMRVEGSANLGCTGHNANMTIESEASLSAKELQIYNHGICSVDKTSTIKADTLAVNVGGTLTNNGTISALSVEGGTSAISIATGGTVVNNGTLDATVTVDGMLKGSGTFNKDVTVSSAGTLVVGNSPGYQTMNGDLTLSEGSTTVFCIAGTTASSEGNTGWASHTYSQISMASGSLTLDSNANITIEFGGDVMALDNQWQKEQEFSVTLVKGGCASLNDADILETLRAHTTFKLTDETDGRTRLSDDKTWGVAVSNASYSIENGSDLVLSGKMVLTPEPATATLSLLALAGLCARRRRLR